MELDIFSNPQIIPKKDVSDRVFDDNNIIIIFFFSNFFPGSTACMFTDANL